MTIAFFIGLLLFTAYVIVAVVKFGVPKSLSDTFYLYGGRQQLTRLLCPPLSPGVCSNSCPLSWRHYLTTSSSVLGFPLN